MQIVKSKPRESIVVRLHFDEVEDIVTALDEVIRVIDAELRGYPETGAGREDYTMRSNLQGIRESLKAFLSK